MGHFRGDGSAPLGDVVPVTIEAAETVETPLESLFMTPTHNTLPAHDKH